MATTAKKAPARKKAAAKKPAARKPAARKTAARKSESVSFKDSANKAVNIYFGVIGQGIDSVEVALEAQLSAPGTLELACVDASARDGERFELAFDLRAEALASQAAE